MSILVLTKISSATAENEPNVAKSLWQFWQHFTMVEPRLLHPDRQGPAAVYPEKYTHASSTPGPPRSSSATARWPARRRCPPPRTRRVVASLAKFRQHVARLRLYRHRFLQENTRFTFAAFVEIYQIIRLNFWNLAKFCKFCDICKIFAEFSRKI